jgi:octaprenyl-diphosphate synthase
MQELVSDGLVAVNAIIKEIAKSHVEMLPEVVNHLMDLGGKRVRPMLTLLCGKMLGADPKKTAKLAAAVEFIHTATLFHDDVIDESATRRGKSTANSIWGNKASILVGDFLLSHAFRLMVQSGSLRALDMLASAAVDITEAEVWQLELIGKEGNSIEDYIQLIRGKTAVLFASSCAVSGLLLEDGGATSDALYEYGMNLGIIFQITDDVLDYYATEPKFGKLIGGDFAERKVTLPLITLLQNASPAERIWVLKEFSSEIPDISGVVDLMKQHQVRQHVEEYMSQHIEAALESLSKVANLDVGYRELLSNLLYFVLHREV